MTKHTPEQTSESLPVESASNESFNELEQLRLIVFGQAKQALETKIEALQQRLSEEMDMMQSQINQRFSDLTQSIESQHTALNGRLDELNNLQSEDKATLIEANQSMQAALSSQIELAENAGKDDADLIHKRIDNEVAKLESGIDTSMQDLLAQLEQVSKELSSSKTDRKTLAQMLANMASNLEEDV